jgi:hypothetical protein
VQRSNAHGVRPARFGVSDGPFDGVGLSADSLTDDLRLERERRVTAPVRARPATSDLRGR